MTYREEKSVTEPYKKAYLDGLEAVIRKKEAQAEEMRAVYIKDILENTAAYRKDFINMLGWPLTEPREGIPKANAEKLAEENGYAVYRMQFEVLDGFMMTGLFFKMLGEEKRPLVIVQHGGQGTPELVAGAYGDTSNYHEMLARVQKHGVHVFAPQLLLWNEEVYGIPYDRKETDARLKRVGGSVTAVEVYGIQRILDYFETQPYVGKFGMVGLSYGGFYTLFTAAADTRILSSVSCSFFNKRSAVPWIDWTWQNAAYRFDDAEIACLVRPRKICLQMGNRDELFDYRKTGESFDRIKEIDPDFDTWAKLMIFDGIHEFCKEDAPIAQLVADIQ